MIDKYDDVECLWSYVFQRDLKMAPSDYSILISEKDLTDPRQREKKTEIIFETFDRNKIVNLRTEKSIIEA